MRVTQTRFYNNTNVQLHSLVLLLIFLVATTVGKSEHVTASTTFRICYLPESSLEGTVAAVHILSAAANMSGVLSAIQDGHINTNNSATTSSSQQQQDLVSSVLNTCDIIPLGVAASSSTPPTTLATPSSSSSCVVEVKVLEVQGNTAPRDIVEAVLGDPNCSIVIGLPSLDSKLAAVFPAASQPWIAAPVTTSGSVVAKEFSDSVLYPWFNSVGTSQEALGVGAAELFSKLGWTTAHEVKFNGFEGAVFKDVYTLPEPYVGPLMGLGEIADNAAFFGNFNGAFSDKQGSVVSTTDFKISINSTSLIAGNLSTRIVLELYIRPVVQSIKKRVSESKLIVFGIGVSPDDATNVLCHIAYFTCTSGYITEALDTYYQVWRDVLIEEGMHKLFVLVFTPNFPTVYLPPGAFQIAVRAPVESYKSWWTNSATAASNISATPTSSSLASSSLVYLNTSHSSMTSLNQVNNMSCGDLLEVVGAYRLAVSVDALVASVAAIGAILTSSPSLLVDGLFAPHANFTTRAKGSALLHQALRSNLTEVLGFSGPSLGMVSKSGERKTQELRILHMPATSISARSISNPFSLMQVSTSETGASVAYTILVEGTSHADGTTSTNVTVSRTSSVINWFADASIVSPTAAVPDVDPVTLIHDHLDFVQLIVLIVVLIIAFIFVVSGVLLFLYVRRNPEAIRTISSSISSNNVSGPLALFIALIADTAFTVFIAETAMIPIFLGLAVLVSICEISQWIWRHCTSHQSTTSRGFGIASMLVELSVPSLLFQNIPFGAFTSYALFNIHSTPSYILPSFIISLLLVGYRSMRLWDLLENIPWLSLCTSNANQTEAGYMLEDSDEEGEEGEEDEEDEEEDEDNDSSGEVPYDGQSIHAVSTTRPLPTPLITSPTESILCASHPAMATTKVGGLSSSHPLHPDAPPPTDPIPFPSFPASPRENSEGPRSSCTSDTPKRSNQVMSTSDTAILGPIGRRRRERSVSILTDVSGVAPSAHHRRQRLFRPKEDDNKSAWLSILKNALFAVDVDDAEGFVPGLLTSDSDAPPPVDISSTDPLHGGDHELQSLASGSKASFGTKDGKGLHQFDRMCVSRSTFASFIYRTDPGRYKELADFTDSLCLTLRVQHDVLTSELQSILLPLMRLSAIQDGTNKFIARYTTANSWHKLHEGLLSSYQKQANSGLPAPASEEDQPPLTSLRVLRGVLQFTATGLREGSQSLLDTVANYHSTETSSFWNPSASTAPKVCAFSERDILTSMASQDARVASLTGGGAGKPNVSSSISPPLPSPQHRDANNNERDPERSGGSILSIHSHFQESLQGDSNRRPVGGMTRNFSVITDTIDEEGNNEEDVIINEHSGNNDRSNNTYTKDGSADVDDMEEDVHKLSEEDLFALYMQNEEIKMLLDWKIHLQHFTSDAKKATATEGAGASGCGAVGGNSPFVPLGGVKSQAGVGKGKSKQPHRPTPHHIELGFTDLSTLSPADIEGSDVLNLIAFGKMASAMSLLAYQWDNLKTTATGGNDPTVAEVADLLKTLSSRDGGVGGTGGMGSMAINRADRNSFMDTTTGVETDEQINATAKLYVKGMKIALKQNKFRLYLEHLKEVVAFKHAQDRHRKRKVVKNRLLNCFKAVAGIRNPLMMMAKAAGRGALPARSLLSLMGKGNLVLTPTAAPTTNPLAVLSPVQDPADRGGEEEDAHQQPCSNSTIGSVDIV